MSEIFFFIGKKNMDKRWGYNIDAHFVVADIGTQLEGRFVWGTT